MGQYNLVSSAKSPSELNMLPGKSLTYMIKRVGPKTLNTT